MAVAFGHLVWGIAAYREPLAEIVRAGVTGSVGDGLFDTEHADDARAAAFWFTLVAPLIALLGHLADAARRTGDRRALVVTGASVTSIGAVGVTVMPRSGFWCAPAIGAWLVRSAHRSSKQRRTSWR